MKAHRWLYPSTLGARVIKKQKIDTLLVVGLDVRLVEGLEFKV